MPDGLLNQFLAIGTAAERAAFTPDPPTVLAGPDQGYAFYETDTGKLFLFDGAALVEYDPASSGAGVGDLLAANNLSDLASPSTARTNLGVDYTTLAELIRDTIGAALVAGSGVTVTVNDADDTITLAVNGSTVKPTESMVIASSDESTALTTGTAKVTFRMPYAFTLSAVRASLTTAQTSGSIFTVDINEGGASILSTKLTIDNTEKTSTTAATAAVISDVSLADDAEITVDIDQVGDGTAKGLKVVLIGSRT